ncbi:TolR [Desulforapulum autotrophicum HRM2]|uniref:TolR n=1 Tax=Desulforapulum autotrophicum (strain ATCC 43914 / DSM 3382 / VKM B-1955 / HRM2) TaxID=177437 RepID=C0QKQ1_DESAH|nr:protein TolR [Desulforapulum autotrophicum]ACN16141.1 TolR [Desulforapulum autotrophicum HRM2]
MQSGHGSFGNDQLMGEINVTPFVDVMLVLLIIFMVTAPMMVQGVDVNLPQVSSTPLAKEEESLVISIKVDGQVFINDQVADVTNLTEKLRAIFGNVENRGVLLKADREVPYGVVVNVMSRVRLAGVTTLGLITLPAEDKS